MDGEVLRRILRDRPHGPAEQVFQAPSASLTCAPDCNVHCRLLPKERGRSLKERPKSREETTKWAVSASKCSASCGRTVQRFARAEGASAWYTTHPPGYACPSFFALRDTIPALLPRSGGEEFCIYRATFDDYWDRAILSRTAALINQLI